MSFWAIVVFAVWPVAGLLLLGLCDRWLAARYRTGLPLADRPGEVLARMYLWPIVCWKIWRALSQGSIPANDELERKRD
jgi:hypothetical protein